MVVPIICTGRLTPHYRVIRRALHRHRSRMLVRFLGFVPPSDLKIVYRLSDGLIFPSLFEGWGLPVVEAFALGVPVACAAVTSLPDLVEDAALLFDPTDVDDVADAIGRLWSEPDLRRALAESGHRVVQNLDWTEAARLMQHHYRAVAARSVEEAPGEPPVPASHR
jgi:alpha-1,3-rhamnosyl/mannosyltransferase